MEGLIECTAGQTLEVRATVTQGTTEATGMAQYRCTGHVQRWVLHVVASDGALLTTGIASAHVWAKTLEDGDVHEWDDTVRVVGRRE